MENKKKELPIYFRELRNEMPRVADAARSVYMTLSPKGQKAMMSDYQNQLASYRKMDDSGKTKYRGDITSEYNKYMAYKPEKQKSYVAKYTSLVDGGMARGTKLAIRGKGFKGVF
tara:strand:- start:265 stop:609 length:345 start_codon:yes stop_codon:yes gene_type:complete